MARKTVYVCQSCGAQAAQWIGQCRSCREWNTLVEERIEKGPAKGESRNEKPRAVRLSDVRGGEASRWTTALSEFDRVLGGGMVPASVVLIGGEPGIGKSTLLLQMVHKAVQNGTPGLYVTGEESLEQIKMRAERLSAGTNPCLFLATTALDDVRDAISETHPRLVVIDSIQVLSHPELDSAAGSVGQIRETSNALTELAKRTGFVLFLVGHVTKEGAIAGPKLLEHMVDTVLYFEGERHGPYRLLRSVKNRFGPTHEIGVFEMTSEGLREVEDPSSFFLSQRSTGAPGSAVTVTMKGTRPLLVEVQALVSTAVHGFAQRTAMGVDRTRTSLLIAVLEKIAGVQLGMCDVFVNVAGGIEIDEPSADLAVAAAIASSQRGRALPADAAVIGELGLAGEVRTVSHLDVRMREAAKLGFKRLVVPRFKTAPELPAGVRVDAVGNVDEALSVLFGG